MRAAGRAQQGADGLGLLLDGLAALTVQHGEQVVAPLRRMARASWVRKKKLRDQWTWNNATTVNRPGSAKLDGVVALIMAIPDCGHIVFCDNIAIHRWMQMLLVEAGIPLEPIPEPEPTAPEPAQDTP